MACNSYRVRKWYLRHLHKHVAPAEAQVTMEDGQTLSVRPRHDDIQRQIYLHRGHYAYEPLLVDWLAEELDVGMTVIEVGAHVGYFATQICRHIGPSGSGVFIEALPENYELLSKNLRDNGFGWSHTVNAAASDKAGTVTFYPATDSGRNSLFVSSVTDKSPIQVQAVTLDSLLSQYNIQSVDILQIDVEGAEDMVIRGAASTMIEKRIRLILCEFHPEHLLSGFGVQPLEFLNRITSLGYKVSCLDSEAQCEVPFGEGDFEKYQHLVFRPCLDGSS